MNKCKNCGCEIRDSAKFCSNCGASSNLDNTNKKLKKRNFKIIIPLIMFILICVSMGVFVFMKINTNQKENMNKSIEVLNIDTDNYPNIVVSVKANNYQKKLEVKNFTLKENDAFQKDLTLADGIDENQYKISYKTSHESTKEERNIKIAYLDGDNEVIAEYSYNSPEKKQNSTQVSNTNNVVDTYDHNEVDVKQAIDNYEKAYIRMINSKDIYYIKNSIDLSGSLISEFTDLIKSYSEQRISEDLMDNKIEQINKINDSQYEVIAYEKYYISYGKDNKSSYTDFRTSYVINKTDSGFKVYSIKNITKLGSKTNP
jgi:predicted nucleic acid-binding Zn ribbon protein